MQRVHVISALAILAVAPVVWAVPDAPVAPRTGPEAAQDPKTAARNSYRLGHEGVQSVIKLEIEASSMPALAGQYRDAVRSSLTKARENFRQAVAADPEMKEGWNMVGYTSRRLGEYEESLSAYDKALALQADYPEAIEYRAELFVATGRFEQAKEAYATLLKLEPSYAGMLKTAMQDFVKSRPSVPARVTAQESEAFAKWVESI